jgi:PhnB protein
MAIKGSLKPGQLGITLFVRDIPAATAFYREILGATEIHRHLARGDVVSIEMRIGDAHLSVAGENPNLKDAPRPDWPRSPQAARTTTALLTVYVDDVDETVARALAAGATLQTDEEPIQDAYWGDRVAGLIDPAGHLWRLQTAREEVTFDELPGRRDALAAAHRARRGAAGSAG